MLKAIKNNNSDEELGVEDITKEEFPTISVTPKNEGTYKLKLKFEFYNDDSKNETTTYSIETDITIVDSACQVIITQGSTILKTENASGEDNYIVAYIVRNGEKLELIPYEATVVCNNENVYTSIYTATADGVSQFAMQALPKNQNLIPAGKDSIDVIFTITVMTTSKEQLTFDMSAKFVKTNYTMSVEDSLSNTGDISTVFNDSNGFIIAGILSDDLEFNLKFSNFDSNITNFVTINTLSVTPEKAAKEKITTQVDKDNKKITVNIASGCECGYYDFTIKANITYSTQSTTKDLEIKHTIYVQDIKPTPAILFSNNEGTNILTKSGESLTVKDEDELICESYANNNHMYSTIAWMKHLYAFKELSTLPTGVSWNTSELEDGLYMLEINENFTEEAEIEIQMTDPETKQKDYGKIKFKLIPKN